jgi:ABC-2 type transport system permease protein
VAAYVLTATLGAAVLLVAFAVAMALTAGPALGDTPALLGDLTGAALSQLPAVLVVAGAAVAAFALLPRRAVVVSWLVLGASVLLSPVFGLSLGLPDRVLDLSPFAYLKAPAAEVGTAAIVALLAIAAGLIAAGLATFRRRDIAA